MTRFQRNGEVRGTGSRELKIGLVGLGYWGPNLMRVLSEMEGVSVTKVCDVDRTRLARTQRRYPAVATTQFFDDLCEDPELDAIVIATPIFTHHELTTRSLEAGKHTLVEKPLAPSVEEAEELHDLAGDRGRVLMCGHTFLYSPAVRAVKDLIDRGELGDIYFISASRVNLGLHQQDVSVVWDLAPHDFSILRYWLGETPERLTAMGRDSIVPGIPDVAFIDMAFPSGILAHVELSWLAPSKLRRTVVVGSKKMVVYEDGSPEPLRVFDQGVVYQDPETFGQYHLSYRTGNIVSPRLEALEPLALELQDFVRAMRTGSEPTASTDIARDVVGMIEWAEGSMQASGLERHEPLTASRP